MPFALRRYRKRLLASRLLTAAELGQFERSLPRPRPRHADALVQSLIAAGKLTAYQAAEIDYGRGRGLVLGNYVLLDALGSGGMGRVFKARHRRLQRTVALKTLNEQCAADIELIERFRREAWAVAQLAHPNIVAAYDADEADGVHFLVMEFVDGPNLSDLVRRRGPLPVEEAVRYTLDAARGLAYAHAQGFVHRDVKPSNLVLDPSGPVKLLDLGLARAVEAPQAAELTMAGDVVGTAEYMAPEQAFDTHRVDARADIYSLGATLYRLLTGELMYRADTPLRFIAAHREQPIPPLGDLRDDVPRWLETLYKKMVAKDPADRPQSMDEVVSALQKARPARRRAIRRAVGETPSRGSEPSDACPLFVEASDSGDDLVLAGPTNEAARQSRLSLRESGATFAERKATMPPSRGAPLTALAALAAAIGLIVLLSWKESPAIVPRATERESPQTTRALVQQWSRYLGSPEIETNSLGMQLALIPPGEFEATCPFYCGVHEVTVEQFRKFVEATGYRTAAEQLPGTPSWRRPVNVAPGDRHPVVELAPADAQAFCDWLSQREGTRYRLPTEAEWEHACRAGGRGAWWFGDDPSLLPRYAWYAVNGGGRTHQVGLLEPNPFGLHDPLGNAAEWCAGGAGEADPTTVFAGHVLRGGGWSAADGAPLHVGARGVCPSSGHSAVSGFRVLRELPGRGRD